MSRLRAIGAIARADFLERVRRYSFLLTLLSTVYLGYLAATGTLALRLGEYRGLYTPAWIGTMMALVTATFVSLAGFYIVKNAVDRDRLTGVGQILAASPLSKTGYMLGKLLSNFAVLTAIVGVLALAAVLMQFRIGETERVEPWALLSPFALIAMPVMALTAAFALAFETFPGLRGGFGNTVWFFCWAGGLALPLMTNLGWLDPIGLLSVMNALEPAGRAAIPGYRGGVSLSIATTPIETARSLRWEGVTWTGGQIALRLAWVVAAVVVALCAAAVFDRFDTSRLFGRRMRAGTGPRTNAAGEPPAGADTVRSAAADRSTARPAAHDPHLTPLGADRRSTGIARAFTAELRLAVRGSPWWWYGVALALLVAQLAAPLEIARGPLLAAGWIWPILVWSAMGSRETRFGTGPILSTCSGILSRQLPASWLAGLAVTALTGSGALLRLVIADRISALAGWMAGALLIPSLALALGVWSGSGKLFEALYTVLWYVGPLNRTPGLDFTGSAGDLHGWRDAGITSLAAGALLGAAFLGRIRQLHGQDR